MPKKNTQFICQSCGHVHPKWAGRCSACNEWGTIEEEVFVAPPKGASPTLSAATQVPVVLADVQGGDVPRTTTGIGEFDRVLGGGLVPGALILVGGDPGIGKSTLLLQVSDHLARDNGAVLYVTGEESPRQTKMRFDRIGGQCPLRR